jgi:hypothetical protein
MSFVNQKKEPSYQSSHAAQPPQRKDGKKSEEYGAQPVYYFLNAGHEIIRPVRLGWERG